MDSDDSLNDFIADDDSIEYEKPRKKAKTSRR